MRNLTFSEVKTINRGYYAEHDILFKVHNKYFNIKIKIINLIVRVVEASVKFT